MSHCRSVTRWIVVVVLLALPLAAPATAQARDTVSLDATIGASAGSGGRQTYNPETGVGGEVTLGIRVHPERPLAAIGALSVGSRRRFAGGDTCLVVGQTADTRIKCAPFFPALTHLGVLAGVETRAPGISIRALAGPAGYAGDGAWGFGAQTQLDAAIGFSHLALVAAVRGSWIARVTGETFLFRSLEFGLRVQ